MGKVKAFIYMGKSYPKYLPIKVEYVARSEPILVHPSL